MFWGFFLKIFLCWWYGEPMVRVSVAGMKKATLLWEKVAWGVLFWVVFSPFFEGVFATLGDDE